VRNLSGRRTIIRNDFTSSSVTTTPSGTIAAKPQGLTASHPAKRSSKGRVKSSTVALYTSVFALLVAVIAVGYRAPEEGTTAASAAPVVNTTSTSVDKPAVNDVVANDIAASVAAASNLAIAPNVAERAVSTRVQTQYASSDVTSSISKPTIVQLSTASRNITKYAVVEGDTVESVAAKFAISADTVKWANNLTNSTLAVGSNLDILPRDGIVYTVKDGDTVQSLADKYKADGSLITTYNDLEISGLSAGLKIVIPGAQLPTNERPGYVAPRAASRAASTGGTYITGFSSGFSSGSTYFIKRGTPNTGSYAFGNCTAYAFDRRAELGRPIGQRWGNAGSWATNARSAGYTVNRSPAAGAVIQDSGHVAIVEEVLANGDLRLSEMNARVSGGGFNIVSGRILPAGQVGQYYYIH
jgi:surface antigen